MNGHESDRIIEFLGKGCCIPQLIIKDNLELVFCDFK